MRISDWSSDVCSSDLGAASAASFRPLPLRRQGEVGRGCPRFAAMPKGTPPQPSPAFAGEGGRARGRSRSYQSGGYFTTRRWPPRRGGGPSSSGPPTEGPAASAAASAPGSAGSPLPDRKRVGEGKTVSGRFDLGGP